jgi:mono/diheme cytochrome c family protein
MKVRPAIALWMFVALPAASQAADAPPPGVALFEVHCGICHEQMGTGTMMLARRLGGDHALLADRTDLTADYVTHVVRNGIGSMPPQTRVDLSDAELASVVAFLTRPAAERGPPQPWGRPP